MSKRHKGDEESGDAIAPTTEELLDREWQYIEAQLATAGGFFLRAPRVAAPATPANDAQRAREVAENRRLAEASGCGVAPGPTEHVGLVEQDDPRHWGGGR